MIECGLCGGKLHEGGCECPGCGARLKRDIRGLVSGPAFLAVGLNVSQYSVIWGVAICLGGLYGFSTLRNFRWVPAREQSE